MRINLDTALSASLCELINNIDGVKSPAVVLDRELKIVAKNFKAKVIFTNLRRGRRISAFAPNRDCDRLYQLAPKQTAFIEMNNGKYVYGATAIGFEEGILLLIRPVWSGIHERLEKIYSRASGYDLNLASQYTELEDLWELFLSKYSSAREIGFFNVATATKAILKELPSISKSVSNRVSLVNKLKNSSTLASEYDFAVVFAYLLFLCSEISVGKMKVELAREGEDLVIKYYGTAENSHEDSDEIFVKFSNGALYWQNLIRLLTDGNLWEIGIRLYGEKDFALTFRLPSAPDKQPFAVSESFRLYILCALRGLFHNSNETK